VRWRKWDTIDVILAGICVSLAIGFAVFAGVMAYHVTWRGAALVAAPFFAYRGACPGTTQSRITGGLEPWQRK